jgi:hypothetical protein
MPAMMIATGGFIIKTSRNFYPAIGGKDTWVFEAWIDSESRRGGRIMECWNSGIVVFGNLEEWFYW